ncbi:CopG family transcriptional regulator [Sphingobium sp. BS19]|uniref:CopG family transcriptional regulator n=1 Tax=Sphingobium sp. BS19 TaxID=3018973 RepID=UPI0022EF331A|nr:CopG family transcriptional regulator [Sphingobium sp. BS19]GLI98018.1 CopG family transcriptional regulator [Sphingobium sp. BS19]
MSRTKFTVRLPPDLLRQLGDHARAKRVSQTAVVEAALQSFLSPDGPERLEAAFARRLDRMARQYDRLAWNVDLTTETLALFVRLWLIHSVPLPDANAPETKAMGRKRWDGFVQSLMRKMERGTRLGAEISQDVAARAAADKDG